MDSKLSLDNLVAKLANYNQQRAHHQQIFHQFSGAIAVLEEQIAELKKLMEQEAKEKAENGETHVEGAVESA